MDYEKISGDRVGESSEAIRARVQAAGDIQNKRFSKNGSSEIVCNADMRVGEIRQSCKLLRLPTVQNNRPTFSRDKLRLS